MRGIGNGRLQNARWNRPFPQGPEGRSAQAALAQAVRKERGRSLPRRLMKNLVFWLVGISLVVVFAEMPVLSQSTPGQTENTSNPQNGGGSYAGGDNGGSPNAGVTPGDRPGQAANTSSAATNYVVPPPATRSSSSTLPDNGGVPPVVVSPTPPRDLGYSSTLPDNGGVPPKVTVPAPPKDLGYASTLPDNGGKPPVLTTNAPPRDLGYSSTLPDNGGKPPMATTNVPSYSSTLPDNGGVPPSATAPPAWSRGGPERSPMVPTPTNTGSATAPLFINGTTNAAGVVPVR